MSRRHAVVQVREALDKAVAIQQEQEALLADGVKRLTSLQEKERTMPSPFSIPEPTVPGCVQAEFSRLQSVIDGLQKELASLRSGQPVQAISVDDDDDDAMDSRHKRSKTAPNTPLAITRVPGTPSIFNGIEGPSPFRSLVSVNPSV